MQANILVVDDDQLMRRSVGLMLEQAGYQTQTAATAEEALILIQETRPDLVLLDIGLPGMDGLEALQRLHRQIDVPVIFVTARRRELDTILGLELGADGYITKPFNPDLLLAHVRSVLRRTGRQTVSQSIAVVQAGDIVMDPAGYTLTVAGQAVELTAREFELLLVLAREPGRVFSMDELINWAWGPDFGGEPQAVYVHIRGLREKIEEDPQNPHRIINVRGVGYKLLIDR